MSLGYSLAFSVCVCVCARVLVPTGVAIFAGVIFKAAAISNCGWRCVTWERENTENFAC